MIENKEQLIVAVGNAMEHYLDEFAAGWYIDYTTQDVVMIEDYIFELDDNQKSEVQWESDMAEIVRTHRLERIDPPSNETKRRVMMAQELLGDTDLSVMDIALQSGFFSLSTFNRVFKDMNGCSPTEYRKMYLQGADVAGRTYTKQ